jgi:ribonuclease T2
LPYEAADNARAGAKALARILATLITLTMTGGTAFAQAPQCIIPKNLARPKVERAQPNQMKKAPVTGNILALSWSPQFCRERAGDPRHSSQCNVKGQFGFILHGLWPDGPGRNDPAWCAPATPLPPALLARNFCMMPSVQLQQHQWAKHGTCASRDPDRYFKASAILYDALKWPDMNALSFERPRVGDFIQSFVAANPGLPANAVRVTVTAGGWLDEVRICLDTNYRARPCPRDVGGASPKRTLKIWREELRAIALVSPQG